MPETWQVLGRCALCNSPLFLGGWGAGSVHSSSALLICLLFLSLQVLFKMVLGSAKFGEAALFLTIVGSANFVFVSFVPIILYFTHVEYIGSPQDIPWAYLCGVAGLLFGMQR